MEIFIALSLLFSVMLCLIAIIPKEKKFRKESSKSECYHQSEHPKNTGETTSDTVKSIFRKHYNCALKFAKSSAITNNAEFELLVPMCIICEFATSKIPKNEQLEILDNLIYDLFYEVYPELSAEMLSRRLNLYEKVIESKSIRYLWAYGNKSIINDDIIANCAAIWGDITCNPECADDYHNAPILIHDAFFLMSLTETVKQINAVFYDFFKDFYQNIILNDS